MYYAKTPRRQSGNTVAIPTSRKRSVVGFSLVELMVVVAIIGIMATLAVPRMNAFISRARSAEARAGLDQIYKLQQSWRYDNDDTGFLDGAASAGLTKSNWTALGNAYGYQASDKWDCTPNRLGFRIAECHGTGTEGEEVDGTVNPPGRYAFYIDAAGVDTFTAIAIGAAWDDTHRIFPGCSHADQKGVTLPAAGTHEGITIANAIADHGDVWGINEQRTLGHLLSATQLCATD